MSMTPRQRTRTGWFLTLSGFLACPCHLVVTLPLAVAVLSGTALGGWIATHQGAIALGTTLYFLGALALGMTLLLSRARPTHHMRQEAQLAGGPACERRSMGSTDSTVSAESTQTTAAGNTAAPAADLR
jgi:MerE protein